MVFDEEGGRSSPGDGEREETGEEGGILGEEGEGKGEGNERRERRERRRERGADGGEGRLIEREKIDTGMPVDNIMIAADGALYAAGEYLPPIHQTPSPTHT